MEIEGLVIEPILDEGRDEVSGREIPEFQEIAPALQEDAEAELIRVNDVDVPTIAQLRSCQQLEGYWVSQHQVPRGRSST
jgi:hypothetical protein